MAKIYRSWVLMVFFGLLSVPSAADLLSAMQDYHQQNYRQAYAEFSRLSTLGNGDAIYNIGVMYLQGQGVEQDLLTAHSYFSVAADFGLKEARSAAAVIAKQLTDGAVNGLLAADQPDPRADRRGNDKSAKSLELKAHYQQLAAQLNYPRFVDTLLPIFANDQFDQRVLPPPEPIDQIDANYPKSAYEKGEEGWVWLEFDIDPSGAVKDIAILDAYPDKTFNRAIINAVKHWRYAPRQHNGQAVSYANQSLLYHFTTIKDKGYRHGFSRQQKKYQSKINQLIESAEQGDAVVQYYIANWLAAEQHNATRLLRYHWPQPNAGSQLLLSSATNGYANGQYRLGTQLLRGEYTREDREKGLNWIVLAAQAGFIPAQYRLGRELLDQRFVEYDRQKAQRWLTLAADQGHFRAQRDLVALLIGQQMLQKAQTYLDKAFAQDHEHPDLWHQQSLIWQRQGDEQKRQSALTKARQAAQQRHWYSAHLR